MGNTRLVHVGNRLGHLNGYGQLLHRRVVPVGLPLRQHVLLQISVRTHVDDLRVGAGGVDVGDAIRMGQPAHRHGIPPMALQPVGVVELVIVLEAQLLHHHCLAPSTAECLGIGKHVPIVPIVYQCKVFVVLHVDLVQGRACRIRCQLPFVAVLAFPPTAVVIVIIAGVVVVILAFIVGIAGIAFSAPLPNVSILYRPGFTTGS